MVLVAVESTAYEKLTEQVVSFSRFDIAAWEAAYRRIA